LKNFLKSLYRIITRLFFKRATLKSTNWLDRKNPFSRSFGLDRGEPIDRKMIEKFLESNSEKITGRIMEIGDDRYTIKYGRNLSQSIVFTGKGKSKASIAHDGDLTDYNSYSKLGSFDCVIATNVLNFIYDFDEAVLGLSRLTNTEGGVCLVTVAGISPISRYDYDRYGDYWRFNDLSIRKIFEKYFEEIEVLAYGNAPLCAAFIMGLSQEEIPETLYDFNDKDYQILISVKARLPRLTNK
jgi:hypothetical protein